MRSGLGGPCSHCGRTSSPCWRKGPPEKPLLCNACGARYLVKRSLDGYLPGQKPPKREGASAKSVATPRGPTLPATLRSVAQGTIGKRKRVLNPRYAVNGAEHPLGWKSVKESDALGVKVVLMAAAGGVAPPMAPESPRVSNQDSAASHFTTTALSVERTSSQESTDAQPSSFEYTDGQEDLRASFTSKVRAYLDGASPPPSPSKSLRAAGRCRKKSRPLQSTC